MEREVHQGAQWNCCQEKNLFSLRRLAIWKIPTHRSDGFSLTSSPVNPVAWVQSVMRSTIRHCLAWSWQIDLKLFCFGNIWCSSPGLPNAPCLFTRTGRVTCHPPHWSLQKLLRLSPFKACGPDAIPNRILKLFACELSETVITIFNWSLSSGDFPSAWRDAYISPVPRASPVTCDNDLRPVALTECLSKVFEDFVV